MDRAVRTAHLVTGVSLPYVEQGDRSGTPALLLHAWGESLRCFDRLLPSLPLRIHALAMDQRGHGGADKPAEGYALADFANDIEAFMDAVGISSAVLIGSSSGGYVAQQLAVTSAHRVAGLALVGSPRSLRGRASFADQVDQLTDPIDSGWVRASLAWFPRFHEVPQSYIEDRVLDGVRMPAHVWRKALAGLSIAQPPTEAGTITAATLIIWGDRDELLSRQDQEALSVAIPGSRFVVYEGTGHLLWEQPERIADDVAAFIERLPALTAVHGGSTGTSERWRTRSTTTMITSDGSPPPTADGGRENGEPMAEQMATERLLLRPWRVDDADAALGVFGDGDVARWLSPAMDRVSDVSAMRLVLQQWTAEDSRMLPPSGRWAIELQEGGRLVGGAILLPLPPGDEDLEMGWQLQRAAWGQGYATEAGRALAQWAFGQGADEVFAVVRPANKRAEATVRRIGMEWVGETGKYYDLRLQVFRLRPADLDAALPRVN